MVLVCGFSALLCVEFSDSATLLCNRSLDLELDALLLFQAVSFIRYFGLTRPLQPSCSTRLSEKYQIHIIVEISYHKG